MAEVHNGRQIRTLAMSQATIPPALIGDFFTRGLASLDGVFTYRRKALACGPGSLVLFQYAGAIRAAAVLDYIADDVVVDEDGVPWPGAYVFKSESIGWLSEPIFLEELRRVAPNVHVFGQASHTIALDRWDVVVGLLRDHGWSGVLDVEDGAAPLARGDKISMADGL